MSYLKLTALAVALSVSALYAPAIYAQDFHEEEFSADADGLTFEPDTRDPLSEPDLDGVPPVDWADIRTTWVGLIEENLVLGDPGYPGPDPGSDTPEYGVVQPEGGDGPVWRPASFDNDCPAVCFNIDNYADPLLPPGPISENPAAQVPDFWWTNAISDTGGSYLSEAGITGLNNGNGTWTYATTGPNNIIAVVPDGFWYELEVCLVQGVDGDLDVVHNVWDATHTVLLGSFAQTTVFLDPPNQTFAPRYSWFTNFRNNVDVIFVDDFRVECVPEPGSLALLGVGALGLAAMVRRRRRA